MYELVWEIAVKLVSNIRLSGCYKRKSAIGKRRKKWNANFKIRPSWKKLCKEFIQLWFKANIPKNGNERRTSKKYPRRTRKLLETKLSSRNLIKWINTVPLVKYSGPFLKWTRDELRQMGLRSRKLMTRDDVNRLYVSRNEGGRGLTSFEDRVDASIQRLKDNIEKHERGLIRAIRKDIDYTTDDIMAIPRKQKWEKTTLWLL